MILYRLLYIVLLAPVHQQTRKDVTLNIQQRVNELKRQIAQQIKAKQRTADLVLPDSDGDYAYVDLKSKPITPISNRDKRKKDEKFKLREIITKRTRGTTQRSDGHESKAVHRSVTNRPKVSKLEAVDTFYRRASDRVSKEYQMVHCQDLITPFLSGFKKDMRVVKRLMANDPSVVRLLQLLRVNTTLSSEDEIYSILYQISNIQIRLFQWDVDAMKALLSVLTHSKTSHSFRKVRAGLRRLLFAWHMDFSNTTNLLKQSRLFRPPCTQVSEYGGSTQSSKVYRYTKSKTPKTTCSTTRTTAADKQYYDEGEDDDEYDDK